VGNKEKDDLGKELLSGDHHYRAFVGPPKTYDVISAIQFNLMTFLGLREHHYLLDIGCGSLRGGRLSIAYLLPGHYYGIEPEQWLIEEGIQNHLGSDIVHVKQPTFSNDHNFTLSIFNRKFDFILAQSIFSHASENQIRRCLSEAKKVMRKDSIFAASFVKGTDNYKGDKWVYPGCVYYTAKHIKNIVREHDLFCKFIDWYHPSQQWMLIANPEYGENISNLFNPTYLKDKLEKCHNELTRIQEHPYVKFGLKIFRLIRQIR
jgi:SAM-dependent methyltransferase